VAPFAAVLEKNMANIILLMLALLNEEQIEKPEIQLKKHNQEIHNLN
jgi:hypothetical protein